ncbi:MAG: Large cysteine-rich periplasmic protein OmcB [Planctomycetota bacterium]
MKKRTLRQKPVQFLVALAMVVQLSQLAPRAIAQEDGARVASRSTTQFGKMNWPQRSSTSNTGKTAAPPSQPGIFRGGLVQQLRSITNSVLGDSSETNTEPPASDSGENRPAIPTPPSLKDVVDAPADNGDGGDWDQNIPDSPELDVPQSRDTSADEENREAEDSSKENLSLPSIPSGNLLEVPSLPEGAMPTPSIPGTSRWRNQKVAPVIDPPGTGTRNRNGSAPRTPTASTPNSNSPISNSQTPKSPNTSAARTGSRPVTAQNPAVPKNLPSSSSSASKTAPRGSSNSRIPTPPSNAPSLSLPADDAAKGVVDSKKPIATSSPVPEPSKTNSSRKSVSNKLDEGKASGSSITAMDLNSGRVKLSDRQSASSGNTSNEATTPEAVSSDSTPLVSKKLPPARSDKRAKAPALNAPTNSVTSSEATATTPNSESTSEQASTSPSIAASGSSGSENSPAESSTTETSAPSHSLSGSPTVAESSPAMKPETSVTAPAKEDSKQTTSETLGNRNTRLTNNESSPTPSVSGGASKSLDMEIPSVMVRLVGPGDIPVGRKGDYELTTKNTGAIPLNGVVIRMDIPKGVTADIAETNKSEVETETMEDGTVALLWQVAELGPGKSKSLPVKLTASEAKNFAIALEWTVLPQNGELLVNVQQPLLQIGLEGPSEAPYGMPQMYRLKISNPGTAIAEDVVLNLSAEPYGSNSSPIGSIAPGSHRVVEVELTFQQRGNLKIKAEAVGAGNLKSASEVNVHVKQAVLQAALTGPETEYVGAIAEYSMELTNSGDAVAENVIAQIQLPEGVKLSALPNGTRLSGRNLLWEVSSIEIGKSAKLHWQSELQNAGDQVFEVTCRGSAGAAAVAKVQTLVEAVADLKLTLSDPPSPAPVGEEVNYELEIFNQGKQSANQVRVVAQFSEGIEPSKAEGAEHKIVTGQVIFEPIAKIAPGEKVKLQVRALASQAGVHRFRIEVQTEDQEVHHVLEESTRYMQTAVRPTGTKLR